MKGTERQRDLVAPQPQGRPKYQGLRPTISTWSPTGSGGSPVGIASAGGILGVQGSVAIRVRR